MEYRIGVWGGQGCAVGREDDMKTLRGREGNFGIKDDRRPNADIPNWLAAPSPLLANE